MGTRADFYVGRGRDAQWLGRIYHDGYPDSDRVREIIRSATSTQFRQRVRALVESVGDDAEYPGNTRTTPTLHDRRYIDWTYAFALGRVFASNFGKPWKGVDRVLKDEQAMQERLRERWRRLPMRGR